MIPNWWMEKFFVRIFSEWKKVRRKRGKEEKRKKEKITILNSEF